MTADGLNPFLEHPSRAGLFLDFDGTLSDIAHVPHEARPVTGARELLAELSQRFGLVAVVSGRSAHQLLEWLGPNIEIWGVHGSESAVDGEVRLTEEALPYAGLMGQVKTEAAAELDALALEGVVLEDKGVMIGLHFRGAKDPGARAALDALADELAARHGLTRAGGRLAFELRPPAEFTKRAVVLRRTREEHLAAAMFVGDDRVDLPAWDGLDVLAGEGVHTLRVAVDSDEAPPELLARADVVLGGPAEVIELLRRLR